MKLAETLRAMRAAKNEDQSQVGKAVGVSRHTISNFERGRTVPSLAVAQKLATHLGFSLDSLD